MRVFIALIAVLFIAMPAWADNDMPVEAEKIEKINALLASMNCEVDDDNIEREDDGFELDDVICADGQYDIDLDSDLNVTGKRAE